MIVLPTDKLIYFKDIGWLRPASWVYFQEADMAQDNPFGMHYIFADGCFASVPMVDMNVEVFVRGQEIPGAFFDHLIDSLTEYEEDDLQEAIDSIRKRFSEFGIKITYETTDKQI